MTSRKNSSTISKVLKHFLNVLGTCASLVAPSLRLNSYFSFSFLELEGLDYLHFLNWNKWYTHVSCIKNDMCIGEQKFIVTYKSYHTWAHFLLIVLFWFFFCLVPQNSLLREFYIAYGDMPILTWQNLGRHISIW